MFSMKTVYNLIVKWHNGITLAEKGGGYAECNANLSILKMDELLK